MEPSQTSIVSLGISMFRQAFTTEAVAGTKATSETWWQSFLASFKDQIDRDRNGELVDLEFLKTLADLVRDMSEGDAGADVSTAKLYDTLRVELVEQTRAFYRDEALEYMPKTTVGAYCRHVQRRLAEEKDRFYFLFHGLGFDKIVAAARHELIEKHHEALVSADTGVGFMEREGRKEELELLLSLAPSNAVMHS